MLGDNASDLAREFNKVADLRPSTRLPVRHISLSFAPGDDGKVSDLDKEAIVVRVVEAMGYEDCQFVGIAHHRDDPGHDLPHDHDHLHIVINAVDVYGERVSDSWDRFKIQPILRDIERDFGLQPVKNSWEIGRDRSAQVQPQISSDISQLVDRSLENCPDLETWIDRLQESQIDVRFALRKDNKVNGITYLQAGKAYKGSEIGASWNVVEERIPTNPDSLPLILAANAKSQEHPIDLGAIDRQNFDRAATMATMALKGNQRVKTGRLDIKRDGNTLTAYRMRPHRQIFKAIETARGWEPVGCPNIDRVDLSLLVKLSGCKNEPFPSLEKRDLVADSQPLTIDDRGTTAAVPERNYVELEVDSYPSNDEYQKPLNQAFALSHIHLQANVLPAEIEFDVEALTSKIHQSFADTHEKIRQSEVEYSQQLELNFGAFMSNEQPESKRQVEIVGDEHQLTDNEIDRLDSAFRDRPLELEQSNNIPVTFRQIIDLKNYYVKSPEGQAKPESVNALEKFNLHKSQLSQHGKSVTDDSDLKMTSKFFKIFESNRVTFSVADRANLEAATTFAAEQVQISLKARQVTDREPKQRSRGLSR